MTRDELIEVMARATWCEHQEDTLSDVMRHCEVILEAIEAAGMRVVPVEPTEKMLGAGIKHRLTTSVSGRNTWPTDTATLYRAMLHAFYGDAFRRLAQKDSTSE